MPDQPAPPSSSLAGAELNEPDLLPNCPGCRYPLRGLPIQHHCPECGVEFNRNWRCYGGHLAPPKTRSGETSLRVLLIGIVTFYSLGAAAAAFFARAAPVVLFPISFGVISLVVIVLMLVRPRCFIVLSPDGMTLLKRRHRRERRFERVEHYPWATLGRAKHGFPRKCVDVELNDADPQSPRDKSGKPRVIQISQHTYFGLNMSEMDRFIREFNSYQRPH